MATFWFVTALLCAAAFAVTVFLYLRILVKLAGCQENSETLKKEFEKRYGLLKQKAESALTEMRARLSRYQRITDVEVEIQRAAAEAEATRAQLDAKADTTRKQLLAKAEATIAEANQIAEAAEQTKQAAEMEAAKIVSAGKTEQESLRREGLAIIEIANKRASTILEDAEAEAKRRSEKASEIMKNTARYQAVLAALKNRIEGYGNEYIVPIYSLIDELADETAYREAGRELKVARSRTRQMVATGTAAECDYVEKNRKETAIRFVVDAFNGKVDSILTTVKSTNVGTVLQKVRDACELVNLNGEAFRAARITEGYLQARLEEVKWAALAHDVKKNQQEEQRRLRQEMREEQRVKREIEKAVKTAERERQLVEKAKAEIEQRLLKASVAEKSALQAQLAEMEEKLRVAEEQGQRALSMAQQTKRGTVYIISNLGSFGEHVYKIGLTRRLEPRERVRELSDASVPFGFDVHALIESEDAPALEHTLHNHFALNRMNKANHRKEFFRCDLTHVRSEVEGLGLEATWTMAAEAQEFRETEAIERRIAEDPIAREQWLNRQLTLEEQEPSFDEDFEEDSSDN